MVVGGKPVKDEADQNVQNTQVPEKPVDAGDGDLGLVEGDDGAQPRGSGDTRGIGDTRGSGDTR